MEKYGIFAAKTISLDIRDAIITGSLFIPLYMRALLT